MRVAGAASVPPRRTRCQQAAAKLPDTVQTAAPHSRRHTCPMRSPSSKLGLLSSLNLPSLCQFVQGEPFVRPTWHTYRTRARARRS